MRVKSWVTEDRVFAKIDQIIQNLQQGVYPLTPEEAMMQASQIVMRENGRVVCIGIKHKPDLDQKLMRLLDSIKA
jgi:hypothetical protein